MVSDFDLILQINREIKDDRNRPRLEQEIDFSDDVAVELLYLEADHLIDSYMDRFRAKYASQFEKPERFDGLVGVYRKQMRWQVRKYVELTRELLNGGENTDGDGI